MNIARSSAKLFIANVISSIVGFLAIAHFARVLGASSMGMFFLFQALLGMLYIPANLGLGGAVEKRISEGTDESVFLSSVLSIKIIPLAIIVLSIIAFSQHINEYIGGDVAILLAFGVVLQNVANLSTSVLRGELRVGETAELGILRQVTWVTISILLISLGFGPTSLIIGLLVGYVAMLVVGWKKVSVNLSSPSISHARSLVSFGKYNSVTSIGAYFYSWVDVAIIGLLLTQSDVGAYEVAWRITGVVMLLSKSIGTTLLPQVSQWDAEENKDQISSAIMNTITPSIVLVVPSFFGVMLLSEEILGLMFGPEFTIASLVLVILMGEKIFQSVSVIISRVIMGIDRPDLAAYATICSILVNIILNFVLITRFGLVGAAIATSAAFILNTALHGFFLSRYINLRIPFYEIGWCFFSSVIMLIFIYGIQTILEINTLLSLISTIFASAVVYSAVVLSSSRLRKRLIPPIRQMLRSSSESEGIV